MKGWNPTLKEIDDLKKAGKIKDYKVTNEPDKKKKKIPSRTKISKEKCWITDKLYWWCHENKLTLEKEFQFAKPRRWRFDFCILSINESIIKFAVEYEGIFGSKKSRHTTRSGYSNDSSKYNAAAKLGIIVLRYTATTYKNLEQDLKQFEC